MISAYINLLAYGIAFLVDLVLITTVSRKHSIKSNLLGLRDHLMSFWVSNLSLFNAIVYWAVASVRLEGIHPPEQQKLISVFGWYNQYLRTTPALITLLMLTNVNYKMSDARKTISLIVLFSVSYSVWMVHLARVNGKFPYRFVEKMNNVQFIAFTIFGIVFMILIDRMIRKVSSTSSGIKEDEQGEETKRKNR